LDEENIRRRFPLRKESLKVAKRARGREHLETAEALKNLGLLFRKVADYAKAEPLLQEALRIRQKA
jgi:uncharacterized protein HemY